jgi:beta-N-acetylhexosaminidase
VIQHLERLPLEAKIGQMMVIGFDSFTASDYLKEFIVSRNLGGVILFARNIDSPEQVTQLNKEIQQHAIDSPWRYPLWICVDQEGGSVTRLNEGVCVSPGNMNLAAGSTFAQVEEICELVGRELKSLGFNMNLAPMGSLCTNRYNTILGTRTFGDQPEVVKEFVAASVRGYQKHLLAVAKGFPGHGDAQVDAHKGLSSVNHDMDRLESVELKPFLAALDAGVEAIMTTHVHFARIDPDYRSSSLSRQVIDEFLRKRLGFDRLVITDCMEMKAVTNEHQMGEAAVLAVEAGADLLLISHTPELQEIAFHALLGAVRSGRITETRIDLSLKRIDEAKRKYANKELTKPNFGLIGSPTGRKMMEEAAYRGITLLRDRNRNLPLQGKDLVVIEPRPAATNRAEDVVISPRTLANSLSKFGFNVSQKLYQLGADLSELNVPEALTADYVIFVTQDGHCRPEQIGIVHRLTDSFKNLIVIGSRTPYEIDQLNGVGTYLCAYSNQPIVWDGVCQVLMGKPAVGKLPVWVSSEYRGMS